MTSYLGYQNSEGIAASSDNSFEHLAGEHFYPGSRYVGDAQSGSAAKLRMTDIQHRLQLYRLQHIRAAGRVPTLPDR